jgi:hypothetical protein
MGHHHRAYDGLPDDYPAGGLFVTLAGTAVSAVMIVAVLVACFLFWWPLLDYSWRYWFG